MEKDVIPASADDDIRTGNGVVASIHDLGHERFRIAFDDVVLDDNNAARAWRHRTFFTSKIYEYSLLRDMTLSDGQYRDIGIALVARLLALNDGPSK